MAESSDFFCFVEDVALNLELPHHAELPEMFQKIITGNSGLEGDGVFRQFKVAWLFLCEWGFTSWMTASVALEKVKSALRIRLLMELSIISTNIPE
jgi:hypothetical protein